MKKIVMVVLPLAVLAGYLGYQRLASEAQRLIEVFPGACRHIRLFALDPTA